VIQPGDFSAQFHVYAADQGLREIILSVAGTAKEN